MTPEPGTSIGPYLILEKLGEGGMGSVFRAMDTRLEREVAIKLLPERLVQDEESRARFRREAKMLAALNHRGIGAIYDVADWNGLPCLVLELVKGQTLEQMLGQACLPVREAVLLFQQAAEALESAHSVNILHRDLKPGNMMITPEGQLKILDFGLAKALNRDFAGDAGLQTRDGDILGTAAYFAPEQLYSAPLDQRVDIWALCCCLFQSVTGKQPFPGKSLGETLNLIVNKDPDWVLLPEHPLLRALLQDGLRKEPRMRLSSVTELRARLQDIATQFQVLSPIRKIEQVPPVRGSRPKILFIGLLICLLCYWVGLQTGHSPTSSTQVRYLSLTAPQDTVLPDEHPQCALSPDGQFLVFPAVGAEGKRLYRRDFSSPESVPLKGTEGGSFPFLSADGRVLGYFSGRALWSIPSEGGAPIKWVGDLQESQFLGACWLPDQSLVWASTSMGLRTLKGPGQAVQTLLSPDPKNQQAVIGWPAPVSGGLLFSLRSGGTYENGRIEKLELPSGKRSPLEQQAFAGQPGPSGGLLYVRGHSLMLNSQVLLADLWSEPSRGESCFSAAKGMLAFVKPVMTKSGERHWVDRGGKTRPELTVPPLGVDVRLSADGHWLAYRQIVESARELWVQERPSGLCHRLVSKGDTAGLAFHPNSDQIAFGYDLDGPFNLYCLRLDGSNQPVRLTHNPNRQFPKSWSAGYLLYEQESAGSGTDIWALPDRGEPFVVAQSEFEERDPALSPDGAWLAYQSDESGSPEIYLMAFPKGSRRRLGPGMGPTWTQKGELLYRNGEQMMSLLAGNSQPKTLFGIKVKGGRRSWEVTPDGTAFFLSQTQPAVTPREICIGLNLPGL